MENRPFRILLIEDNPADVHFVRATLAEVGGTMFLLEAVDRLTKGLDRLRQGGIDVVLSDLMLPDSRGFETFAALRRLAPDLPIVLLSGLEDEDLAIRAVREGAQDYLLKGEANGPMLARALRYAIERNKVRPQGGNGAHRQAPCRTLGFIGSKGGVGTTTVAFNVACALAKDNRSVILVELRPWFGTLSEYTRQSPSQDLGGILELEPQAITDAVLAAHLYKLPSGLKMLFAPQRVERFHDITPDHAQAVIKQAASAADFLVLDLPCQPSEATRVALSQCNFVGLAIEPEPFSIASARVWLQVISAWGLGTALCGVVVVHRVPLPNPMKMQDVRAQLCCEIAGVIPPAGDLGQWAQKSGMPLVLSRPDSNAALSLSDLASRVESDPIRYAAL